MTQIAETFNDDLIRRHRAAVTVILWVFALTVLLTLLTLTGVVKISLSRNPSVEGALRIAIAVFGVGAIVLRRTKFSAMRLQDIAALGGPAALLGTLYKTTVHVALLAAAIAVMGFVLTLYEVTENDRWLGLVAVAVLVYAYPRRAAWQRVLRMTARDRAEDAQDAKGRIA